MSPYTQLISTAKSSFHNRFVAISQNVRHSKVPRRSFHSSRVGTGVEEEGKRMRRETSATERGCKGRGMGRGQMQEDGEEAGGEATAHTGEKEEVKDTR